MSNVPAIQFDDVSKRFLLKAEQPHSVLELIISQFRRAKARNEQVLWAVRNLTLDVMPAENLGIIGRNGAGKSTLLKMVARILRPTGGRLIVNGRVSALLELGAGFHMDLTGRENIYLNGSVLGMSRQAIDECFDSIVDFSELEDFIDIPVRHYSSGMYMRLGFSVAVHVAPDILLVDEVLAVGDQGFKQKCFERINQIKREGTTIVMVSHHMQTVRNLCSQVVWLENGTVKAVGSTPDVLAQYAAFYAKDQKPAIQKTDNSFIRWGTGEMEITGVRFLNEFDEPSQRVKTGDSLTVAIDYVAHQPIHCPVFELSIYRDDGLLLSGPTQQPIGLPNHKVQGSGTVNYCIERVPLLPAGYKITVAVHDGLRVHAYDCHELAYEFQVTTDNNASPDALIALPAHWDWLPHKR